MLVFFLSVILMLVLRGILVVCRAVGPTFHMRNWFSMGFRCYRKEPLYGPKAALSPLTYKKHFVFLLNVYEFWKTNRFINIPGLCVNVKFPRI